MRNFSSDAVLVSACLLGLRCRYDGKRRFCAAMSEEKLAGKNIIPICPEQLGGLPTPRKPCEILGGTGQDVLQGRARIVDGEGNDYSERFLLGAREALCLAQRFGAKEAWLMARSPSCGCGHIYDGSFSAALREGDGLCTALLKEAGLCVRAFETTEDRTERRGE